MNYELNTDFQCITIIYLWHKDTHTKPNQISTHSTITYTFTIELLLIVGRKKLPEALVNCEIFFSFLWKEIKVLFCKSDESGIFVGRKGHTAENYKTQLSIISLDFVWSKMHNEIVSSVLLGTAMYPISGDVASTITKHRIQLQQCR